MLLSRAVLVERFLHFHPAANERHSTGWWRSRVLLLWSHHEVWTHRCGLTWSVLAPHPPAVVAHVSFSLSGVYFHALTVLIGQKECTAQDGEEKAKTLSW